MNENTKATQTWGSVERERIALANQRWNISLSTVALLSYRCLMAIGIIITIIIVIDLDRKQFRLLDFMYRREAAISTTPDGSESLNRSKTVKHSALRGIAVVTRFPPPKSRTFSEHETYLENQVLLPDSKTRDSPTDYVVYNPSCEIPNYPALHKDVILTYRKYGEFNCTSKPLLTSVTRSASGSTYVLQLHQQYLSHYLFTLPKHVACCYSVINSYNDYCKVEKCEVFNTNVELSPSADGVRVSCKYNRMTIYEKVHFLVPDKSEVRRKIERVGNENNTEDGSVSVMIVGMGAVSRLNLLRTMPETVNYLERNGWYALKGYHKIEKNALHNLVGPVLTGHSGQQLEETNCTDGSGTSFGSCPWIWKDFADKNYITAYGEDGPTADSFVVGKFEKQPTDYFLRPLMRIAGELVHYPSGPYPMCLGPKRAADDILDFSADFASRFVNHPTFSLFWLNSPGRLNINYPAMVDKKFVSYFDALNSSGALNRTMVVFMSDHGSQLWQFRQTYMGFVEDSMPFLYVWLPKWYRDRYPNKVANLAGNKNKLASHFDLYLTLMDVLGVRGKAAGCPKCVSLFDPVPWNRGCADAGIADESCNCRRYEEISTNSTLVKQLASLAAAHMNSIAANYSNYLLKGYNCSTLTVSRILSARREIVKYSNSDGQLYAIHIVTAPGKGIEEAVTHVHSNNTLEVKSITEYAYFELRSFCMKSRTAKPWCTCQRL